MGSSDEMEPREIAELLIHLGHWARVDFESTCTPDEYVAHEVIFLRALARFGDGRTGKELAQLLGWTPGRVSQVAKALEAKGHVTRGRRLAVTASGVRECSGGAEALGIVAARMLGGVDASTRHAWLEMLRRMKQNVGAFSRVREDPSRP